MKYRCHDNLFIKVNRLLALLQDELQQFILRMAAEFPHRKEQLVFLINNYDMMLAVLKVNYMFELFEFNWSFTTAELH